MPCEGTALAAHPLRLRHLVHQHLSDLHVRPAASNPLVRQCRKVQPALLRLVHIMQLRHKVHRKGSHILLELHQFLVCLTEPEHRLVAHRVRVNSGVFLAPIRSVGVTPAVHQHRGPAAPVARLEPLLRLGLRTVHWPARGEVLVAVLPVGQGVLVDVLHHRSNVLKFLLIRESLELLSTH